MRKYLFYLLLSVLPFMGNGQLLNEGFEGTTFPPTGWTTFTGTNGLGTVYNWGRATTSPYQGAGYAFVRYENVTGGIAEDWMVTPAIDLTDYENAELSFYTRQDFNPNWGGNYYVKVSTTSQTSHASFTDVATWTELTLNTTYNVYEQKTVDLSAYDGQIIYLAFVMTNDDGDSWYVDDVVVNADEVVVAPTGCLTATFGLYPSATYTPLCFGVGTIVTDAWAGEYSNVNVTAGTEYTFASSVATDFITIANATGTTVLTSGTGSVTWTAAASEVVRFYTHADAACTDAMASRARTVECGEPFVAEEPAYDCFQGDGLFSNGPEDGNGINPTSNFRVADDFTVAAGEAFSLEYVRMNVLTASNVNSATLNIRADAAGMPGAVLHTVTMVPSTQTLIGGAFGFNLHQLEFVLATPIDLTEGVYWLEPTATNTSVGTVYWEVTSTGTDGSVAYNSNTSGTSWVANADGMRTVFFVAGECETIEPPVDGCLEAENGQYPTATFVPACLGMPEDITTLGWTGEYSVVQVTNGEEYIFTVSDPTYFITIGDATGTTVLGSGTGSLTWTSTLDGEVRFYTHFNSDCEFDAETFLSRTIQCGEVPPPVSCDEHEVLSNSLENGLFFGGDTAQRLAVDIQVGDGDSYSIAGITANVAGEATSFEVIFYNDAAGLPGTEITSVTGTIGGEEMIGSNFGFDWYTYTVNFDAAVELAGGSTYWMEVVSDAVAWESTTASVMGMNGVFNNINSGGAWSDAEEEFVYSLICGTVEPPTGCLEAENGLYPSDTFTPACEGTPEEITALAWTGEYSNVQVTAGTAYTFSSSIDTDFVTIGNEDGTVVLASGVSSVTWTPSSDQVVRFYLHLDEECDWAATGLRSRIVQCGEIVPPTDYCEPVLDCTDGDVITNVTFAGINNDTDCSPNGYGDYTAMQAEVEAGETYSMSVTVGAGWTYESTMVWIDFNNDFIFDPVTEYFFIGSDPGTTNTADITIPAGTADGNYRLRVRVGAVNPELNDLSILACDEDTVFGETEDYTLVVGEGGSEPTDCEQIFTGEATGGAGSSSPYMSANDFDVAANVEFTLQTVSVDVVPLSGEVTTFDVYIYEDNNGPGSEVVSHLAITPTSVTANGLLFDLYPIYTVEIALPTPQPLSGGTAGAKYWASVVMGPSTTAQQVFWIFSPYDNGSASEPLYQSPDDGGSWAPYADETTGENAEGVMTVSGTCGDLGVSTIDSFDFAYYPNPVKDELNITSQKVVQSVSVYNLAGQQISTQKLNVNNGKVSTSSLAPGVYVFRAVLDGGQIETFKVIKK